MLVAIDGFFTSHFIEPVEIPDQETVDAYLPPFRVPTRFDIEAPAYISNVVNPEQYMGYRQRSFEDMDATRPIIREANAEYERIMGRGYGVIEAVDTKGAEIVLATSGAMTGTARVAVAAMREKGVAAGLLKLKALRPFPREEVREALAGRAEGGGDRPERLPRQRRHLVPGAENRTLRHGPAAGRHGLS